MRTVPEARESLRRALDNYDEARDLLADLNGHEGTSVYEGAADTVATDADTVVTLARTLVLALDAAER